jgi:ribonucleoside-diphosphate reductase alpha chain
MNWDCLLKAVRIAVRFLDDVIDAGERKHPLKSQKRVSLAGRRIGLGVMGLADAMVLLNLKYGSRKSVQWIDRLFREMKEAAYETSIELAKEKGAFPAFESAAHLRSPFIQALPKSLRSALKKNGLRNCALLAIAPTGSISILAGISSGIEPIFASRYLRHVSERAFHAEHPLIKKYHLHSKDDLPPSFVTAHEIPAEHRLLVQAAAQQHIDQSISSTMNLPEAVTPAKIEQLFWKAWKLGCKGITVFREGTRSSVIHPIRKAPGAYEAEKSPPVGICVFCEPLTAR